ncbi:MAG: outer membrane lipoprotein-sorting protein [Bacteroidota bacterium]
MRQFTHILWAIGLLILSIPVTAQNAKDIIRKAEEVRRGVNSAQGEMTMTIIRPNWTRSMSMKSWSSGDEYALILVTAPAKDKGIATLKREKQVWNWLPKAQRTMKMPPSAMSQSWMNSDFTNDDLVREASIITDYDQAVLKDSVIEGRTCWKIELIPHEDSDIIWGRVVSFIDQKDYLTLRSEFFDEDGYLVNILNASEVKVMGGKTFATRMEMVPVEKKGHKTVIEYKSLQFDKKIPENYFSVANLKRVR